MLKRGWEVTGCDISPSMLQLARAQAGSSASLSIADMRMLPVFGEFDLVWSLDDAMNYLLSPEELQETLSGMRRNLGRGGLLMFDLNTLGSYRTFFAETKVVERDGWRMVWRGQAKFDTPPGSICESHLEVSTTGPHSNCAEGRTVPTHAHRQRHFPEEEVLSVLEEAGLECLDVYGHGEDAVPQQPVEELAHQKAVFIARTKRG